MCYLTQLQLLATQVAQDGGKAPDAANNPGGLLGFLPAMLGVIILYYFLFIRPDRRKQGDRKAALDSLKKNDRVVTIGGIYGVVMNVQRDTDEVTLKIDETNNTKIRVQFGAIARVLNGDEPAAKDSSQST